MAYSCEIDVVAFREKELHEGFLNAALLLSLVPGSSVAQVNGTQAPEKSCRSPSPRWLISNRHGASRSCPMDACWHDRRSDRSGFMTQKGRRRLSTNVPAVLYQDRAACSACSRRRSTRPTTTFTSPTPPLAEAQGTSGLALARAS